LDASLSSAKRPAIWRHFAGRLAIDAALCLFLGFGIALAYGIFGPIQEAYNQMREDSLNGTDFTMLYAGSKNVVSSERSHTYELDVVVGSILQEYSLQPEQAGRVNSIWLRYYNPPVFLFLLSPLTLLDLHVAYLAAIAINVAATGALVFLLGGLFRWRHPHTMLVGAAVLGFVPTYWALYHFQPTVLIAVALTGAFMALEKGRGGLASAALMFALAKPQWLAASSAVAVRLRPRMALPLGGATIAVGFLPFLLIGPGSIADYVDLATSRGISDLSDVRYAAGLLSWPGFFWALSGDVQTEASLAMTALSLAAFALVLLRGDRYLSWTAAICTTLIAVPHSHAQEWILLAPAAAILLARPGPPSGFAVSAVLSVCAYLAVNSWLFARSAVLDGERSLYLATPAALLIVLWCAVLPLLERRRWSGPIPSPWTPSPAGQTA